VTVPTPLHAIVEALGSAGATEEIIAAAVKAGGEFGGSPPRRGGRPRKYADRSLRDRAYRERKKARDEILPRDEMRDETRRRVTKFRLRASKCAMKFAASGAP